MPITKKQLAVYTNGALFDHTLYTDSVVLPSLGTPRIYGLDEHSRTKYAALQALLEHHTNEATCLPKDRTAMSLLGKDLEAELTGCAFVSYTAKEQAVTYLYFKDTAVAMPAGMQEEVDKDTYPFTVHMSTELNMGTPFVGSSPDTHVWVKA